MTGVQKCALPICSTLDKTADALRRLAQPGDLILTVGAGDIYRAGEKLLEYQEA